MEAMAEPRAKRTHARRSCELCKVRKTRCELPDLDIPSGSTALPADKACHRCKVLALPCVVDDASRRPRKRASDIELSPQTRPSSSMAIHGESSKKRGKKAVGSIDPTLDETLAGVNHALDIVHAFDPDLEIQASWP